jgi:hypothetical protein
MGRRITPEQREDGDALFQTDGHMIFDGEVQDQVHSKRLVGKPSDAADFRAKEGWRAKLGLQDTEATRVTHRCDKVGAGQIRPHRRGDDRVFDPQQMAEVVFMNPPRG